MREIKFRIWHKPTKKYVTMSQEDWSYGKGKVKYKDSGDFLAISHDGFLCHEGYGNGAANVEDPENYVVQQYTGLKDKNGKEIYEGDILGYFDAIVNNDKERVEIKYWGEQWCEFTIRNYNGKDVKSDEPNDYYGGIHPEYKEVIGNIFEGVDK